MSTPTPGTPRGPGDTRGESRAKRAGKEGAAAARETAQSRIDEGKRTAASVAGDASDALDETAASLSARGQDSLAEAATAMSDRLSQLSGYLEGRSTDELMREARRLARDNPAMFVAGGVALGLALSRFFKASSPGSRGEYDSGSRSGYAGRIPDPASPSMSSGSTGGAL